MLPNTNQSIPPNPKLYYIAHIDNLSRIARSGYLYSDALRIGLGLESVNIGMTSIKHRRLNKHQVTCHPGTLVGQYVPFYFCPRSIMLFIISRRNHPELSYRGGQDKIVHLQLDMNSVIQWAKTVGYQWAFTDRNAADALALFYNHLQNLDQINWQAVEARDFRDRTIQDGKQAEFLVYERVAWELVEKIGVIDRQHQSRVTSLLSGHLHLPEITVERMWYY